MSNDEDDSTKEDIKLLSTGSLSNEASSDNRETEDGSSFVKKVVALRQLTGASVAVCKEAINTHGSVLQAEAFVREAMSRSVPVRNNVVVCTGTIASYVHHDGSVAAIVEVKTETDFACRSDEFKRFARELAMHYAFHGGTEDEFLLSKSIFDEAQTVASMIATMSSKLGELVVLGRMSRITRR